ncbi:MAG: phosphopyruvate hydratase [Candidatus Levyibacteriota bacterium]
MKISEIKALEILDSRGNPTIRTFLTLDDKSTHSASVPSGASTGANEAVELRDGENNRYNGLGVLKAVENVNNAIRNTLVGKDADPKEIDKILIGLDGTPNKGKLGANAILSVSLAVCRAAAHSANQPLWQFLNGYFFKSEPKFPQLMVNIVNGGKHAGWNFDIQEFMVVPNSHKPSEGVRIASEIFHSLGKLLKEQGLSTLVGDEGGYSPALKSNEEVFGTIISAAKNAGYENVKDFRIAIDSAASEFFENGKYEFKKENKVLTAGELASYYSEIGQKYNIASFEDAFSENDWDAFKHFEEMAKQFQFVSIGDDLFCTNPKLIERGIAEKAANGVLIKVNQIGTVTETAEAISLAKKAGWKVAISHRSGETEDNFIADLAYGCGADFLKSGSMSRSERLSKYNRLLEIEKGD